MNTLPNGIILSRLSENGFDMTDIKVECHAGYRGEETPRRFFMGTRKIEVRKVLDCWLSPDHRYFKLLGDDAAVYIIRHDVVSWEWELTFYKDNSKRTGPAQSEIPKKIH